MVLVFAIFFVIANVVALAVYALFPMDRMPLLMFIVSQAINLIIAPIGVLAGGLWGSSDADDACASPGSGVKARG